MKNLITICILTFGLIQTANADVWKWVDAFGDTHFVDTVRPIYVWVDESGKLHYADHPDHEDAVSVQLVWHSKGDLDDVGGSNEEPEDRGYAYAGESAEQRAEREQAEDYYCQRVTEIYEAYLNAPRLYKTDENGERQYLNEADAASTIAETRARKDQICR